jgi:hypothetical protein
LKNVRVPGIPDQHPTRSAVRCCHRRSYRKGLMLYAVW